MTLYLHTSNRVERLVEDLARRLPSWRDADPFEVFPVVVGSRAMATWLRYELATRCKVAAGLAFPLPRKGIAAAVRACLPGHHVAPLDEVEDDPFEAERLTYRLLSLLPGFRGDPRFAAVERLLPETDDTGPVVGRGALLFARQAADVLDRLLYEAPDLAARILDGSSGGAAGGVHLPGWLLALLEAIEPHRRDDGPIHRDRALSAWAEAWAGGPGTAAGAEGSRGPAGPTRLVLFGVSTLGRGDRRRLEQVARGADVHLYALAATGHFFVPGTKGDGVELENPVLAALGRGTAALSEMAATDRCPVAEVDLFDRDLPDTFLGRLQMWIVEGRELPPPGEGGWHVADADRSVAFHGAPGPLRQCEVVRDLLLAAFDEDPTLEPRHVVIQTPDPATFAPLMAVTLARAGIEVRDGEARRIHDPLPAAVSDLGIRERNVVADALLRLLELACKRPAAGEVAELLALPPVRRAVGLVDADPEAVVAGLRASGFRWADTADGRGRGSDPAGDLFTARFAAARLALSATMEDPAPFFVDRPEAVPHAPVAPISRSEAGDGALVEGLALALRMLVHTRARLCAPRRADAWAVVIREVLDGWCELLPEERILREEVDQALGDWVRLAGTAPVRLETEAVLAHLSWRLERPARGDRPITGAITVCGLEPLRAVPFRVVVLLGMDEGVFPRRDATPWWDPLAGVPEVLSRTEIDRHVLLEAILSTRDRLVVTFTNRDPHTNETLPAAVPVEELLEVCGRLRGRKREEMLVEHPLQPFSPRAYDPGEAARRVQSPDPGFLAAARALVAARTRAEVAGDIGVVGSHGAAEVPLAASLEPMAVTTVAGILHRPTEAFVERRLGLWNPRGLVDLPETDPAPGEGLDLRDLRGFLSAVLDRASEADAGALHLRKVAEGKALPGVLSRHAHGAALEPAVAIADRVWADGPAARTHLPVHVDLGPEVPQIHDAWPHWVRPDGPPWTLVYADAVGSKLRPFQRMELWLWLCALSVGSWAEVTGLAVYHPEWKTPKRPALPSRDEARAYLEAALQVVVEAHRRPVHLFPRTSPELGDLLRKRLPGDLAADPARLARLVEEHWNEELAAELAYKAADAFHGRPGWRDTDARMVAEVFAGYDPAEAIRREGPDAEVVRRACLWVPPLAAFTRRTGRRLRARKEGR